MIDVVYPLGSGSAWDNNELRYSLRSLENNLLDLGRVFVVGQRPPWLVEAVHIPMEDTHRHNKDANLIDKVLEDALAVADRAGPETIVGRSGVVLLPDRPYARCQHRAPQGLDWHVDIVKGQFMLLRANVLRECVRLGDLFQRPAEEDVVVSACVADGRHRPHLVPAVLHGRIKHLPSGPFALNKRPDHKARRQQVRQQVFGR